MAKYPVPAPWTSLWESFTLYLEAEAGASPNTTEAYGYALTALARWMEGAGGVVPLDQISPEQLRAFLATGQRSTPSFRYRGLKRFFNWLEAEAEIKSNPFAVIKEPALPTDFPQVLGDGELRSLLRACEGTEFNDRRDLALIRFLLDTGARRAEIAVMTLDDLEVRNHRAMVGARVVDKDYPKSGVRQVAFGKKTALALDRYLRTRSRHPHGQEPWLWLGERGRLSGDGQFQAVQRRFRSVGLNPKSAVHVFRHTFSHNWQADQDSKEGDLMRLQGWKDRRMLDRYGASAAHQRALAAHQRLNLGDRI